MAYENILLQRDGPVATITVNRPKSLNALNSATLRELTQAVRECADARALILTGAGEKAFVAGADISEMAPMGPWQAREFSELGHVLTALIEDIKVERPYLIDDAEAVPILFDLLEHEGLCLGGSSGINIAGAVRLAKDLGPGHTIVTILADYGTRYQSKLFNPEFLRSKKLPVPAWLERKSNIAIPFEKI